MRTEVIKNPSTGGAWIRVFYAKKKAVGKLAPPLTPERAKWLIRKLRKKMKLEG